MAFLDIERTRSRCLVALGVAAALLGQLASTMDEFDPRFPFMPGTELRERDVEEHDPYEAVPDNPIAE